MNKEEMLLKFAEDLRVENLKQNLVSRQATSEDIQMHIADSLAIREFCSLQEMHVVDIGTGGGFPGLVLAMEYEKADFTLLESDQKKSAFLQHETYKLGMTNCAVCTIRAETAGQDSAMRESFDCCTARAVAELRILLEYALPLVRVGGRAFFWKGSRWQEEVEEADHALKTLGGRMAGTHRYRWPNGTERILLEVVKEGACPEKYPRRVGVPAKRPL